MKNRIYIALLVLLVLTPNLLAQESVYQQAYRNRVVDYNPDIQAAKQNLGMQSEFKKVAKSDFMPKLMGGANFNYTGNPYELTVNMPESSRNLGFKGKNVQYGVGLSLEQSLYAGGALRGELKSATSKQNYAQSNVQRTVQAVLFEADVKYWQAIAQQELIQVAHSYVQAVEKLEQVAKHRVEVEYADRNDLLTTEVKLNDANYQLLRAQNSAEISRLALYAFANIEGNSDLLLDSAVVALKTRPQLTEDIQNLVMDRPEMQMANSKIDLQSSLKSIAKSKYKPQLSIGIDGNYSSPGYNFKSDLDLNYAVYAKLSVPLFEWGKGRNTRKAYDFSIQMAQQEKKKIEDDISLEIKSSYYNYTQNIDQVALTASSLEKAAESEQLTLARYKEGSVSIVEVLNAQLYHQQAQINYIQSKLSAQVAKSAYERSTLSYNLLP